MSETFRMTATTFFGLEQVLTDELRALGAQKASPRKRAVTFEGDKKLLYKINFHCRTALRILRPIKKFDARTSDDLYQCIRQVNWNNYLAPENTFAVSAVVNDAPEFNNSLFVAQRVKDAVCDRIRIKKGARPSVDLENPDLRLSIHLSGTRGTLSLDASGEPLYKRGYRAGGGAAPLNEVLSAGIIKMSNWNGQAPFVDPMCGSGTLPIEAAMIAMNRAPGLIGREYGFMKWPDYESELLDTIREEARAAALEECPASIMGSDIDEDVLNFAKNNANNAGLKQAVKFSQTDISEIEPPQGRGTMVANAPYGERLETDGLEHLYHRIGEAMRERFPGYTCYILTGNPEAARAIRLKQASRRELYNGKIECQLIKYKINPRRPSPMPD